MIAWGGTQKSEPFLISKILPQVMANIRGRVRRQALVRDGYKCRVCGAEAVIVCYETYDDGDIGTSGDMKSLCGNCHDKLKF